MTINVMVIQAAGGVGAMCLLFAYAKRRSISESSHAKLNLIGSFLVAASSFALTAFAPAILNVVWFFVALLDLAKAGDHGRK